MRYSRLSTALPLAALLLSAQGVQAEGGPQGDGPKWEEMKKKHEECLKNAGLDQKTIDTLGDCHKGAMKDKKEGKDEMKAAVEACMKEKGVTLTAAQHDSVKKCHHHPKKDK
jgi:hypothetical protein